MDPEELEVEEGVADVVLEAPSVAPVTPVAIKVLCTVTTTGEEDNGVWRTRDEDLVVVEEVVEVEVLEVLEDMAEEDEAEEDEVAEVAEVAVCC